MTRSHVDRTPFVAGALLAFMAVLALAQLLAGAYSDDARTSSTIELTQLAVGHLLDALEPYVTSQDRDTRRILAFTLGLTCSTASCSGSGRR